MAQHTSHAQHERSAWSGKLAFILAGAASAVGLGNLWRFPTLAAKYGGGMFILTYFVLAFTFGISLLLLETALGRKTKQSVIGAYSTFNKRWKFVGVLAAAVPFIITPYYCIIGGWVTKYLASYVAEGASAVAADGFFTGFITDPVFTYVFMVIFMLICIGVCALGVKNGIEKANMIMMPLLLVMAIGISIFVLMQPGAAEGAAYYLIPDFSKFSPDLVINALGQMFYSLSLAMGIMVTYGSYLDKKENLSESVASIAGFDLLVSFLAGLMIGPASLTGDSSSNMVLGLALAFVAMPTRSQNIDLGALAAAAAAKGGNAAQQAMQRLQADEQRIKALEDQVKALQQRVFPRTTNASAPVPQSATIESRLAAAEKRLAAAEKSAAAVETRLAKLEARVRALEARK